MRNKCLSPTSFTILIGSFGYFYWGYTNGIINSVLFFLQDFVFTQISETQLSLIASINTIGAAIGSYLGGVIATKFGRRKGLLIGDICFLVATVLTLFENYEMVICGRFLQGVVVGLNGVIGPLYLNEMVPKNMRGFAGTLNFFFLNIGIIVAYVIGFFIPKALQVGEIDNMWRVGLGLGSLSALFRILILTRYRTKETPTFYVNNYQLAEAKEVISLYISSNIEEICAELVNDRDIQQTKKEEVGFKELFSPKYRNAFLTGAIVALMVQFSGLVVMFVFPNVIFGAGIVDVIEFKFAVEMSLFLGIINTFSKLICAYLVEKIGRKIPLVYGLLATALIMYTYSLIVFVDSEANMIAKFILLLWPITFSISVGGMGSLYFSEILPTIGIVVCTEILWISAFLVTQFFLPFKNFVGLGGVFFFFACCSLITTWYFYEYTIETKGKTKGELILEFMNEAGPFYLKDDGKKKRLKDLQMKSLLLEGDAKILK